MARNESSFRVLLDLTELNFDNYKFVWTNVSTSEVKTVGDLKTAIIKKFNFDRRDVKLFVREGLLLEDEKIIILREDDTVKIQYEMSPSTYSQRSTLVVSNSQQLNVENRIQDQNKEVLLPKQHKRNREAMSCDFEEAEDHHLAKAHKKKKRHEKLLSLSPAEVKKKKHKKAHATHFTEENTNTKCKTQKFASLTDSIRNGFNKIHHKLRVNFTKEDNPKLFSQLGIPKTFEDFMNSSEPSNEKSFRESWKEIAQNQVISKESPKKINDPKTSMGDSTLASKQNDVTCNHTQAHSSQSIKVIKLVSDNDTNPDCASVDNSASKGSDSNIQGNFCKKKKRRKRKRKVSLSVLSSVISDVKNDDIASNNREKVTFTENNSYSSLRKHVIYNSPNHKDNQNEDMEFIDNSESNVSKLELSKSSPEVIVSNENLQCVDDNVEFSQDTSTPLNPKTFEQKALDVTPIQINPKHNTSTIPLSELFNGNVAKDDSTKKLGYESCEKLNCLPKVGTPIAYKILELGYNYSPEVSEYKEGIIKKIDPQTNELEIELLQSEIKPGRIGKFENLKEDEVPLPEVITTVSVSWPALIDPRRIA